MRHLPGPAPTTTRGDPYNPYNLQDAVWTVNDPALLNAYAKPLPWLKQPIDPQASGLYGYDPYHNPTRRRCPSTHGRTASGVSAPAGPAAALTVLPAPGLAQARAADSELRARAEARAAGESAGPTRSPTESRGRGDRGRAVTAVTCDEPAPPAQARRRLRRTGIPSSPSLRLRVRRAGCGH